MSTSKHPPQPEWGEGDGPPDDLERNPGIGQSAGLSTGGASTFERTIRRPAQPCSCSGGGASNRRRQSR